MGFVEEMDLPAGCQDLVGEEKPCQNALLLVEGEEWLYILSARIPKAIKRSMKDSVTRRRSQNLFPWTAMSFPVLQGSEME